MKTVSVLIFIAISTGVFAQKKTVVSSSNAVLKEFSRFLNKFCTEGSDTSLNHTDSVLNYRIVFTSQGYFIDPKDQLIRLCEYKNLKRGKHSAQVVHLKNVQDSLRAYGGNTSCQSIKTGLMNNYLEEPLEDSIVNIHSDLAFSASCVGAKEIVFSKNVSISSEFNDLNHPNTITAPSIISYRSGKYLIVDLLLATQIGNLTDSGHILTFYLERMD